MSWLDFKLGARMLIKYPGLTLVGGVAIAFAIAVGAGAFELVKAVVSPTLPLEDGSRIVALRNWDPEANAVEYRASYDFLTWRGELESVEDLSAGTTLERNLIVDDGRGEPVEIAEVTASAFRVARVPPLLGRFLVEADERDGGEPVVVIGYDVWQSRFSGDPRVIGRTVRLGREPVNVVGVMPEGFAFPVSHSLWMPLRLNAANAQRREGPQLGIFGRLVPGATLQEAQAELTAIGQRTAADFPETHAQLRPEVMPYASAILNLSALSSAGLVSINVFVVMLLGLIAGNVALLLFARAATRESEIILRTALGAGRGRIVMQLFAEALVLTAGAAVFGLLAAAGGLKLVMGLFRSQFRQLPFWFSESLAPSTLLYTVILVVLVAVITGVLPALKVTSGLQQRLRQGSAGGGGLRFGGVWTMIIVAQVAVTVAFPVTAFFVRRDAVQIRSVDVGFPAQEYLSARLEMEPESMERFGATSLELERRLTAEPGVTGVTFASLLPRMDHAQRRIELEDETASATVAPAAERMVSSVSVDVDYFDVLGAPALAGRALRAGDIEADSRTVIVNQSFVQQVLRGRHALGRRVRYLEAEPGPWYEIVGVVRDLGMTDGSDPDESGAGVYHPAAPGAASPMYMAVHVRGNPESFAARLGTLATSVDPSVRLYNVLRLDAISQATLQTMSLWFRLLIAVSAMALVLSLTGIYSVMSFTVSRRTREIGIRVALGSDHRRVLAAIFSRPLVEVGLGVLGGSVIVVGLVFLITGPLSVTEAGLVAAYAALMLGVCLLACVVPTRRALQIEPIDALRAE